MEHGVIKKGGAWFTYGEDRYQGREQFRNHLKENPEMMEKLEREIKQKLGMIENDQAEEEKKTDK